MKLGPLNHVGQMHSSKYPNTVIMYRVGETRLLVDEQSETVWGYIEDAPFGDPPVLASEQDRAAALVLWNEDREIQKARDAHTQTLAEGNKAFEQVLHGSIWFNDGEPTVFELDDHPGIKWGRVGRNASHSFFLGADETGQLYYRSICDDISIDDDDEHVKPIESAEGLYLGHA